MADFAYNVAKGRIVEFVLRVKNNDPANSALVVCLLAATNLESQATLEDKDTLAQVVAGTTDECTNTGYARKVLDDTALAAPTPDDANNLFAVAIPNQTWTAVANNGTGNIGALIVCYDGDTTSGTDANIIPMTQHTFAVTPDGSDIVAQVPVGGFYSAG